MTYVESVDLKKTLNVEFSRASQSRTRFAAGDILARRCARRPHDTRVALIFVTYTYLHTRTRWYYDGTNLIKFFVRASLSPSECLESSKIENSSNEKYCKRVDVVSRAPKKRKDSREIHFLNGDAIKTSLRCTVKDLKKLTRIEGRLHPSTDPLLFNNSLFV